MGFRWPLSGNSRMIGAFFHRSEWRWCWRRERERTAACFHGRMCGVEKEREREREKKRESSLVFPPQPNPMWRFIATVIWSCSGYSADFRTFSLLVNRMTLFTHTKNQLVSAKEKPRPATTLLFHMTCESFLSFIHNKLMTFYAFLKCLVGLRCLLLARKKKDINTRGSEFSFHDLPWCALHIRRLTQFFYLDSFSTYDLQDMCYFRTIGGLPKSPW